MTINIPRGTSDPVIQRIIETLDGYLADHPGAEIDLYRRNPVSVRVRIIDPRFAGHDKIERSRIVWKYFDDLPEDVESEISMLVLLTPDERKKSFSNFEFEDPVPSVL